METALVVAIIAAAVLYLARRFLFTEKKPSPCDGCPGCGNVPTHGDANPCDGPGQDQDPHQDPDHEFSS